MYSLPATYLIRSTLMIDMHTDTIVAIATAPGRGGVGVVRLSGPKSAEIARHICGNLAKPREAKFTHFRAVDKEIIDSGIALYFAAPASLTGENVVELQGHVSPRVMDRLWQRAIELGGGMARPGGFSEGAVANGKVAGGQ